MYDVLGFAEEAVRDALRAAADLARARGGPAPEVGLTTREVAAAFASERYAHRPGAEGPAFADLSRFAATADGWIRLHANYPHHRRALLSVLGEDDPLAAAARFEALELEEAIVAAGGCAAAVRTPTEWATSAPGAAAAQDPPVRTVPGAGPLPPREALPAAGVRVLDLTRVIAGPVATRYLAALGADVTRIDPPHLPELPLHLADGAPGKRLVERDLRTRPLSDDELAGFDVLVHGYRPGALDALGLDGDALAERHPHLTVVRLSAWGARGPWGGRRGFDSLVQAGCGIADALRRPDGTPGALPVQALDHATGYRMAAAALRGLARRARQGESEHHELALARTAADLMARPGTTSWPEDLEPALQDLGGGWHVVPPPGTLDALPLRYPAGATNVAEYPL